MALSKVPLQLSCNPLEDPRSPQTRLSQTGTRTPRKAAGPSPGTGRAQGRAQGGERAGGGMKAGPGMGRAGSRARAPPRAGSGAAGPRFLFRAPRPWRRRLLRRAGRARGWRRGSGEGGREGGQPGQPCLPCLPCLPSLPLTSHHGSEAATGERLHQPRCGKMVSVRSRSGSALSPGTLRPCA